MSYDFEEPSPTVCIHSLRVATHVTWSLLAGSQTRQLFPYLSLTLYLPYLRRLKTLSPFRLLLQLFDCLELSLY